MVPELGAAKRKRKHKRGCLKSNYLTKSIRSLSVQMQGTEIEAKEHTEVYD